MKCTQLVVQDHVILRRGLDILDGMVKKLEDGERIEIADVISILKFLRVFGGDYHQKTEETVLFPALLRGSAQGSPVADMLREHTEERALLAGIEEALRSKKGPDFVRTSRTLSHLLKNHLDKEDAVLPHIAREALSKEEDNRVTAMFTRNRTQPEAHANFSRLEWKYTSKPHSTPVATARALGRAPGSATYR
jgi:hemerythrin-like domain-containing protein